MLKLSEPLLFINGMCVSVESVLKNMDLAAEGLWYPTLIGLVLLAVLLFMPKRLSWAEIYLTFGTVGYVTWIIDMPFMARYFDLFDVGGAKVPGIGDVVTYGIIPSCLAIIFLNFCKIERRWLYVGLFTLASFLFEWGLVQVGYMKLKGWQSWMSIPVYVFVYGFWLPWHYRVMQAVRHRL